MAKSAAYSDEEIAYAITHADFNKSKAARKLGCTVSQIHTRVKNSAALAHLIEDYRVFRVRSAESQCEALVKKGHWQAIAFTLTKLGKKEGWGEGAPTKEGHSTTALMDALNRRYPAPLEVEVAEPPAPEVTDAIESDT